MSESASIIRETILKKTRPAGYGMPPPKHLDTWISQARFPPLLEDYLRNSTSCAHYMFGPYSILSLQKTYSIIREHSLLPHAGLVPVAEAFNGDILICRSTAEGLPVHILCHDNLWAIENAGDLDSAMVLVADSLTRFFAACGSNADLPIDFYDAKERHQIGKPQACQP